MGPPEIYVEFANKWPTWLDAVIDVYALANRLGSEYAQNKMMDSLMIILRNPVVRRGQRLTFTLTRFRDDGEETRKSRLADFLVDCVAFIWLTNPAVGLVDPHAVCHQDILSAQSYVRVLVNIGNKYILERLMLQVIKMHISTIFSGSRGRHPAEQVLCTYHVHGTSQVPCASCVGSFMWARERDTETMAKLRNMQLMIIMKATQAPWIPTFFYLHLFARQLPTILFQTSSRRQS